MDNTQILAEALGVERLSVKLVFMSVDPITELRKLIGQTMEKKVMEALVRVSERRVKDMGDLQEALSVSVDSFTKKRQK